jgi:general nucleoside transport system permease protein
MEQPIAASLSKRLHLPFTVKMEERLSTPRWLPILLPFISVIIALIIGGILLEAFGANALKAYQAMFKAAFGTTWGLAETIVVAIPLMMAGLGVSIAFKSRIWNIGAEGQMLIGALTSGWLALYLLPASLSPWLMIPLLSIAGLVGGALWGGIAGLLKTKLGVNEIITTLMLNYVAQFLMNYFVFGPWSDRGAGFPLTAMFPNNAWLPKLSDLASIQPLFRGIRIHLGLLFGLIAALILWIILTRTKWGYEIRVAGENARAATYSGMKTSRNILLVTLLSGALSGLAGMLQTTGTIHRLQQYITGVAPGRSGYGYTAIIVAWLGKLNPWGIVLVSFLFGGLITGGSAIESIMKVPNAVSDILQGTILFVLIGTDIFTRYHIRIKRVEA